MLTYILRRILTMIPTLLVVSILVPVSVGVSKQVFLNTDGRRNIRAQSHCQCERDVHLGRVDV